MPDGSGRALAGRQGAAGYGGQPHRVSVRHSRQFRARVPDAAGRSAGHGDARPPEIFRGRGRDAASWRRISWRCSTPTAIPTGIIRHGNERVLRARFNDARFFWQTDQKQSAARARRAAEEGHLPERSRQLLRQDHAGAEAGEPDLAERWRTRASRCAPGIVHKAALLAKTDLTTELVKEFTELQGIVGGLYAKAQGLDPGDRRRHLRPVQAGVHGRRGAADGGGRGAVDCRQSRFHRRNVRLGTAAQRVEGSVCAAPAGNGIVKIIAEHKLPLSICGSSWPMRCSGYEGREAAKKFTATAELRQQLLPASSASAWSSTCATRSGFAYDVVNAVLAAGADDVVDALRARRQWRKCATSEDFEAISQLLSSESRTFLRAGQTRRE